MPQKNKLLWNLGNSRMSSRIENFAIRNPQVIIPPATVTVNTAPVK